MVNDQFSFQCSMSSAPVAWAVGGLLNHSLLGVHDNGCVNGAKFVGFPFEPKRLD